MADTPALTERKMWAALDPNDPAVQLFTLAQRVDTLTREKEENEEKIRLLDTRIAAMEKQFTKGSGMLLILPFIGGLLTFFILNAGKIFSPWTGQR